MKKPKQHYQKEVILYVKDRWVIMYSVNSNSDKMIEILCLCAGYKERSPKQLCDLFDNGNRPCDYCGVVAPASIIKRAKAFHTFINM